MTFDTPDGAGRQQYDELVAALKGSPEPKQAAGVLDPTIAFLQALDPNGRHNLVAIHPETEVVIGRTFEPGAWDEMRDWIVSRAGQWNLYFSPNEPLPGAPHKKLTKVDIGALRFLYADVDPAKDANFAEERRRLEALELQIAGGMMPASFSIDSGNGLQCLWRLAEKLAVDGASTSWAESFGKGLGQEYGSDAVQNIERVLRLPGTINLPDARKRARGRVAAPARLVRNAPHVYDRATIEARVAPALSSQHQHSDALVAAAAEEIAGEDYGVTAELQKRFDAALEKYPRLRAVWNGDHEGLAGPDDTGSGWRGSLARRMAEAVEADFSALDFARMVHAWTHPASDPNKLTDRNLSRDWGRRGAPFSAKVRAAQFQDTVDDTTPKVAAGSDATAAASDPGGLFGAPERAATPSSFDFAAASRLSPAELQNIPDREFVLGSRFQPGTLTLGAGPAGVSKSIFVILSALAIAADRQLTGELVGRSGRVLIYNAEDPRAEIMRRLMAAASFYGIDRNLVLDRVRIISGYDDRRLVFAERKERGGLIRAGVDVEALTAFVVAEGIVHVALDPLVSLHRGLEENSAADMEALGDQLRRFAQRSGASVDLIHHTVKNRSGAPNQNAGSADAARGSGAVVGFVRSAYTLMPMDAKDGADLGLSKEQSAQLVRLDDAKRNYARRSAHEAWFELRSVLQTGEEIHPRDFGSADAAIRRRAQSTAGVHVRFDISKQRAASAMSKATGAEERLRALRTFVVEAMGTDAVARTILTEDLMRAFDLSDTTARTRIDEACPQERRRAVSVEADGLVYDLWREMRRDGRAGGKWFVVRELKGPAAPEPDKLSAPNVEPEGVFA